MSVNKYINTKTIFNASVGQGITMIHNNQSNGFDPIFFW